MNSTKLRWASLCCFVLLCAQVATAQIVINEINADPSTTLGDANGDGVANTSQDEFVELYNDSGSDLDISGWTISDAAVSPRHTFPAGTVIAADCAIVVFGGGTPTGTFGNALVQVASTGALGLNNSNDSVIVADAVATVIATVSYGAAGNDQSINLDVDITGTTYVDHSTIAAAAGALYSPGTLVDGSAFGGCTPPPPTPDLIINEIHADPDTTLGDANGDGVVDSSQDEFVEIYNSSGNDLDISGWAINDAVGLRHTFPAGTVVAADCAVVVFGGGTPTGSFGDTIVQVASTGFLGLNNGGDTVEIVDLSLAVVASEAYGSEGGNNESLTRDPDISGPFVGHTAATNGGGASWSPGTLADGSNFGGCTPPAPMVTLVLNEIHADPDTTLGDANFDGVVSTNDDEFVEIYNDSGSDIDMSGWDLSDGASLRHVFPAGTIVAADCAIVVFSGGTPTGSFGSAVVQVASTGGLGLNNAGDTVTITDGLGNTLLEVIYGAAGNNQSITLDPDVTGATYVDHSLATTSGGTLFSPGTLADGTAFSGCAPAPALDVVINEILADPDATLGDANGDGIVSTVDDEFVEIYNGTGADLDLSGWTLNDATGLRHEFPAATIIADQCAVVVFGGGTPTGAFQGATAQVASTGGLGLNNGGDTVSLFDGSASLVTEVIYGGEAGNNESITRDPDLTGPFVGHSLATTSGGTLFSPGALADGTNFGGCVPPACTAPSGLSFAVDCLTGNVTLSWTNSDSYSSLEIGRNGVPLMVLSGTDTSFVDFGVPSGVHTYTLFAICENGLTDSLSAIYNQCPDVVINEIRIDQTGADDDEFVEIAGTAGTDLSGITYIVIGEGTGGSGVIESVTELSGVIPADTYFLAAEDVDTFGELADLITSFNFENSDNVTHLLVTGFTGADGQDLDLDDDGTLDLTPWALAVDLIALIEEENPPTATEFHYGPPSIGPDGDFVPGAVRRCPDFSGDFLVSLFDATEDTPGFANQCCDPVVIDSLTPDVAVGNAPLTVTFNAGVSGTDPIIYSWDFDGDTVEDSADPAPSFEYTAGGTFVVTLTVTNDCGTDTTTVTINVCEPLLVDFTATPVFGVAPLCVDFTNLTTGDIDSVLWDLGNGTSADANPTQVMYGPGTYDVTLTVNGPCGRIESSTQNALVTALEVGDCDGNGSVQLADALFVATYLFSNGATPSCPRACDSTGDGDLNLGDALFTLNFLFLGGPTPAPLAGCGDCSL